MEEIIQIGKPVLRKRAKKLPISDIRKNEIKEIIERMKTALHNADNGIAVAAPQIGISLRIFVISGEIFKEDESEETPEDKIYINPKLIKKSRKKERLEEGCLSVVGKYGTVKRSTQATIKATDENGNKFEQGASGLLAQVFQHEIDHLDGVLFVDKAEEIHDIKNEE